jgi:hypothetical protein
VDVELLAFREELRGRWRLPLLLVALLVITGATRFSETRGWVAEATTIAAPIGAMVIAVAPLREALPALRNAAFMTATSLVLLAEFILVPSALGHGHVPNLALEAALVLLAGALAPIEALAARRGFSIRAAALGGMVVALALYLPRVAAHGDPLGAVLAAVVVAVFLGGGAGFAAGIAARSVAGVRA